MSAGTRTACVCSGDGHDRMAALLWELPLLPRDVSMYQKQQEGKGKRHGVRTQSNLGIMTGARKTLYLAHRSLRTNL